RSEPPHQRKVCIRHRRRFVVDAAPADAEERRLLRQRKPVVTVDHRFALGNPALPSARSKKSFSSTSSPILACSDLTSISDVRICCCHRDQTRRQRLQGVALSTS